MTLLLVMEAIDSGVVRLDDTVTASANAASMGGSQVYLKEGERMTLEDMLKSVVIASANDAAVALAEHIAGSVTAFVQKMNERAEELGMTDTHFENVTGLDDTAERHLTSAKDIALMSQALIGHKGILQYSSIWMDSIRGGEFGLTNTNRLVRYYQGCTGLKTGSTSKAGFCVSVTAERNGVSLICVIMGAESRDVRNAIATQLLDWGFAGYGVYRAEAGTPEPIAVVGGTQRTCALSYGAFSAVPTLEEFLALCKAHDMMVNLEIKEYFTPGNEDRCRLCVEKTLALVEKYDYIDRTIINSFDAYVLEYTDVISGGKYLLHGFYPYSIMSNVRRNPDEYLYCACIFDDGNADHYKYLQERGIEPWAGAGVKTKEHFDACVKLGAVLFTSNDPAAAMQYLAELGDR
jgi:hypothetical protein